MTFFLFLILTFTGIVLSFYYIPSKLEAYASIRNIDENIPLGWLMRSAHIWAASGMVATCVAHMLRVYITGSYKAPREFNWVVGMALFVLTMAFGFSATFCGTKGILGDDSGHCPAAPFIGDWLVSLSAAARTSQALRFCAST
jgi:quinol-cytochrome oxidoreductase complex cytochrome b subunit